MVAGFWEKLEEEECGRRDLNISWNSQRINKNYILKNNWGVSFTLQSNDVMLNFKIDKIY